ncbi:MAG: NAD(P)H-dependent oxidoreductase [Leptolyngbya sp.]|nr:NAD(P)H-dependent oxidoreductase [Candidatus Melainabacteria bacterium]
MAFDYLVISTSLNPGSNSRKLAKAAYEELKKTENVGFLDLQEYPLPLCDGNACYGDKNVQEVAKKIKEAKCILMAAPIYNYYITAAGKNLIELTGRAWTDKVVGFLCAAGGRASYMSVMNVANSLMLDFRCLIIPRFVYAEGSSFTGPDIHDEEIKTRIVELTQAAKTLSRTATIEALVKS